MLSYITRSLNFEFCIVFNLGVRLPAGRTSHCPPRARRATRRIQCWTRRLFPMALSGLRPFLRRHVSAYLHSRPPGVSRGSDTRHHRKATSVARVVPQLVFPIRAPDALVVFVLLVVVAFVANTFFGARCSGAFVVVLHVHDRGP